jgi:hypothetical protein
MIPKDVTLDSLMANADVADEGLAKLDATNAEHRAFVISAIEKLVKDFILPAGDLPEANTRFEIFDIEAIGGRQLYAAQNMIERKIPPYLALPADSLLKQVLDYYEVKPNTPEQREKFHRAWAANSAHVTMGTMRNFLVDPFVENPPIPKDVLQKEYERIKGLLELTLPNKTHSRIDEILEYYERFAGIK